MKDQDTEPTGSVERGAVECCNEAVTAYAALVLTDGLTGWKFDLERQSVLCCLYRLSAFATGESAETDRAVITAAGKRLIARDVSLPLTAQEFVELGVQE